MKRNRNAISQKTHGSWATAQVLVALALVLFSRVAEAQLSCVGVHAPLFVFDGRLLLSPMDQLVRWEQTSNLPEMRKPAPNVRIQQVEVPQAQVEVLSDAASPALQSFFVREGKVFWPRHPLNTEASVPYFADAPSPFQIFGMYSASRSLFFRQNGLLYSLKMPTDRPHPAAAPQPGKARLQNKTEIGLLRSKHIREVDAKLGHDPHLQVLLEVLTLKDPETGNGVSVRDLTPLQDGNYYLPAFSIPYVGAEIMKRAGRDQDMAAYWKEHYAQPLGRAKAQLLLRYGLLMPTPNAQNFLLQLDRHLLPTGKIMVRDISDTVYFEPVALALGFRQATKEEHRYGQWPANLLHIHAQASFWKMNEAGIDAQVIRGWEVAHEQAFAHEFMKEIGADPSQTYQLSDVQRLVATDSGRDKLEAFARTQQGK